MDLEIINRKHKDVAEYSVNKSLATIKIESIRHFYLSKAALELMNAKANKFIHVGREGVRWYLVVNDVNTGFPVNKAGAKSGGRIYSAGMVRLFMSSGKFKIGNNFYIEKTKSEYRGSPVFEIMTDNAILGAIRNRKK